MATAPVALPILQRTPEWLDARLDGIGRRRPRPPSACRAGRARAGCGRSSCGLIPGREPTLPMLVGTETEPLNARLYEAATGTPVRRVRRLLRSERYPWMLASLDRRAGRKVVELKWTERSDRLRRAGDRRGPRRGPAAGPPPAGRRRACRPPTSRSCSAAASTGSTTSRPTRSRWRSSSSASTRSGARSRTGSSRRSTAPRRPRLPAGALPGRAGPLDRGRRGDARGAMVELRGIRRNEAQVKAARDLAEAKIKAAMGDATDSSRRASAGSPTRAGRPSRRRRRSPTGRRSRARTATGSPRA